MIKGVFKMDTGMNLEQVILQRISIRTYLKEAKIEQEKLELLKTYMQEVVSPFGKSFRFELIEKYVGQPQKIGTYGMISNADYFIVAVTKREDLNFEALGYAFEKIVLYATYLKLGTCWIGGTFRKSEFAQAVQLQDDEVIPVISPLGYAAKITLRDRVIRSAMHAKKRKSFESMFFEHTFDTPLKESSLPVEEAKALSLLRLAPSAENKQPWKVLKEKETFHFYKEKSLKEINRIDIQRVDMGIAACHFDLAMTDQKIEGSFYVKKQEAPVSETFDYLFSWKRAE